MNFEAKKIILETQDFLAQNIENFHTVITEMAKDGLVTPSDTELIVTIIIITRHSMF